MSATNSSPKRILVTLATGNQGSHLVKALAKRNQDAGRTVYTILIATRNASSAKAKELAALPGTELIESEYVVPELFEKATKKGTAPLYGVFAVQAFHSMPGHVPKGVVGEVQLGTQVVDVAKQYNVEHFVYTSVDQGGLEKTNVPHFDSKREIEEHLKRSTLAYTVLRPTAFMDNFNNGEAYQGRMFNTFFTALLGKKPFQMIAATDIGEAGAVVFDNPEQYVGKTISLAGDELTKDEIRQVYQSVKGKTLPTTFSIVPWLISKTNDELNKMFVFFEANGYKASIEETRILVPNALTFQQFVETHR